MKRERLNEKKIRDGLGVLPIRVCVYSEIDSTNTEAKRYAAMGGEIPCVFLAERQSAGRGRLGRSFYSPEGTGLYLSLLLPVACDLTDVLPMTAAAAVAV